MKLSAALIATAAALSGLADAKVHKVGLKKIPKEDFSIVLCPRHLARRMALMTGTDAWCYTASETEVYGSRPSNR
jgi:hypothetical protein